MSVEAAPGDRLEIVMMTCNHKDGAKLRGGGDIDTAMVLKACEPTLRQLIPSIPPTTPEYIKRIKAVFAAEPLQLVIAVQNPSNPLKVLGVGVIRWYPNTFNGMKLHIEGMATDEEYRSRGVGRAVMNEIKNIGRRILATEVVAQVGVMQQEALRFFGKEKMVVNAFAFVGSSAQQGDRQLPLAPGSPVAGSPDAPASAAASSSPPAPRAPLEFDVVAITDAAGKIKNEPALKAAEGVHRQLREGKIKNGQVEYLKRMKEIFAAGGRMLVAVQKGSSKESPVVLGLVVYRFYTDFVVGALRNWIDDLVTDASQRSQGVGHALLEGVRAAARELKVDTIQLDSGVHRQQAHKFYFRENMVIDAHSVFVSLKKKDTLY